MHKISNQIIRISPRAYNKATAAQQNLEAEQSQFYNTLMQNYSTQFADQSAILKNITSTFEPILAAGPGQQGFTAPEQAAMRTSATENIAGSYKNAAAAVNERLGAQGGGNAYLPSGAAAQVNASLASQAAGQEAATQNNITMENYAVGRQNFANAASALGGAAGMYDPQSYAGAGNTAGQSAFNMATTIQQENSAWQGELGGAIGGIAGAALGGPIGADIGSKLGLGAAGGSGG